MGRDPAFIQPVDPRVISINLAVPVRKLQVTILDRSSQEISQTVRIDSLSLLLRVRISGPANFFFIDERHSKTIVKAESPHDGANCGHG